jgi:hypothetical protein
MPDTDHARTAFSLTLGSFCKKYWCVFLTTERNILGFFFQLGSLSKERFGVIGAFYGVFMARCGRV